MDTSRLFSWGKFLIGWPLSIVSIAFIVKLIADKSSDMHISFSNINFFYLTIGIVIFFIYYLLRSYLWQQQLKERGYRVNFRENTYRFAFSELKRYTPGNIWSFLSRASQFSNLGVDKKTLGVSTLADIQLVIIGCGLVSLLTIPWLVDSPSELRANLFNLLPISVVLITIHFIVLGLIYKKKYGDGKSIASSLLMPGFNFRSKVKLILLATMAYFMFGMGNFFAFLSVYNAGFSSFLSLSSFFVFSLLVGYLSFITPMGLGVREGVVTLGLSKMMSIGSAGTISIFTRIVLVVSELSFLLLVFLWQRSSRK